VQLSQRIGRSTGGIRPQRWTSTVAGGVTSTAWLNLRGKALPDQTVELLSILQDILGRTRLDNRGRFQQLVLEEKASRNRGWCRPGQATSTGACVPV
jgi:presequence protease